LVIDEVTGHDYSIVWHDPRRTRLQAPFFIEDIPPKIQRLFDLIGVSRFFATERETTQTERTEGEQ
jgi:anti-anti-sigma regulatory factor